MVTSPAGDECEYNNGPHDLTIVRAVVFSTLIGRVVMSTANGDDYSARKLDEWWQKFEIRDGLDYSVLLPQAREHARLAEVSKKSLEDKADRLLTFVTSLAGAIVGFAKLTPIEWWQAAPAFVLAAMAAVCCLLARRAIDWHAPTPMKVAMEEWKPKEIMPRLVLSNAFAYYDARIALKPRAAWLDWATVLTVLAIFASGLLLIPTHLAATTTSVSGQP